MTCLNNLCISFQIVLEFEMANCKLQVAIANHIQDNSQHNPTVSELVCGVGSAHNRAIDCTLHSVGFRLCDDLSTPRPKLNIGTT